MTVLDEQDSIPKRESCILYSNFFFFFQKKLYVLAISICHQQCKCYLIRKTKLQTNKTIEAACCSVMPILCGSKKLLQHVLLVTHLWFVLGKALSTYLGR